MQKVIILINKLTDWSAKDESDVLDQANEVEEGFISLGFSVSKLFMDLNLEEAKKILLESKPYLVFNLVEGLDGKANLIHFAPALLESLHIPFTGCKQETMFITSNKIQAKKILDYNNISTPRFYKGSDDFELNPGKTYIAKPLWEDASVGITDTSVFIGHNSRIIEEFRKKWKNSFFIEEYIEGREFNVSVIGGEKGPEVMPLAEIVFNNYPEGKPKIMNYDAKWDSNTFEFYNTLRTFDETSYDPRLKESIIEIVLKCWDIFGIQGYARVDFRVDKDNQPFVLEINANPCIAKDSGFFAACEKGGLSYGEMLKRLIFEAYR